MKRRKDHIDINRLVRGDRKQWERFVRTVSPLVYHVISQTLSRSGKSTKEASDLLQDVFVKLCRRDFQLLRKYDSRRSRLSTWVAVIARNTTIDSLRRRQLVTLPIEEVPEQKESEPPEADTVKIPLSLLPSRQMLIMKLIYEQDLTVREVARILGIKEQSVRSARHKAISTLRSHLAKKETKGDVSGFVNV